MVRRLYMSEMYIRAIECLESDFNRWEGTKQEFIEHLQGILDNPDGRDPDVLKAISDFIKRLERISND